MKECNLITLTKESTPEEIESHFRRVFELAQSGEEFPADIDVSWQLSYSSKGNAIQALQRYFIEGVDYKVFMKNHKNPQGGRPTEEYCLSVACLEFFVARKRREVFEIYRKVFHATYQMAKQAAHPVPAPQTAPQQPSAPAPALTPALVKSEIAFLNWAEKKYRLSKSSLAAMSNKMAERIGLATRIEYTEAEDAVKSASELLKEYYIKKNTHAFNVLMAEHGLSEHVPTKNGSGYFMLTAEGEKYGKNDNYADHQGSVQIHYYIHRFQTLLDRLGLKPDPKLMAKSQAKASNKTLPQPEQPTLFPIDTNL